LKAGFFLPPGPSGRDDICDESFRAPSDAKGVRESEIEGAVAQIGTMRPVGL